MKGGRVTDEVKFFIAANAALKKSDFCAFVGSSSDISKIAEGVFSLWIDKGPFRIN